MPAVARGRPVGVSGRDNGRQWIGKGLDWLGNGRNWWRGNCRQWVGGKAVQPIGTGDHDPGRPESGEAVTDRPIPYCEPVGDSVGRQGPVGKEQAHGRVGPVGG